MLLLRTNQTVRGRGTNLIMSINIENDEIIYIKHMGHTGYVASSQSIQSYIKRVLKMLLSVPLASLITFSGRV